MTEGFYNLFERNFTDELVGIPSPYEKLGDVINSIQQSRYWILGGATGTGKTAFVDDYFVLEIFDWWLKEYNCSDEKLKISWIYNSMERNSNLKIAKWACVKLFKDTGQLVSSSTMIGATKLSKSPKLIKENEVVKQHADLIRGYKTYFDELKKHMIIYSGGINPTGIKKRVQKFAAKNGKTVEDEDGNKTYNSNHPNHYVFVINDHTGKIKTEMGLQDKGILDKHSENMGEIRDVNLFIPIDIYQFNRNLADALRKRNEDMYPRLDDFKGTSDGLENADYVLSLFDPYKYKIPVFNGYVVDDFITTDDSNRLRSVSMLKNSYGPDNIDIGFGFFGEVGKFEELPTGSQLDNPLLKRKTYKRLGLDGR